MDKNIDKDKAEIPILLEKNSMVCIYDDILDRLIELKGLNQQDVEANLNSDFDIKYTMPVFCFFKSPDIDGGKEWHLNYGIEKALKFDQSSDSLIIYRSVYGNKLVRTSDLMFMINIHQMESPQFEEFAANIKKYNPETQIKMLKKEGYQKFTVKLSSENGAYYPWLSDCCNEYGVGLFYEKLELISEKNMHASYLNEYCYEPKKYGFSKESCEYINPTHIPIIYTFSKRAHKNEKLASIIILNKNAEMQYIRSKDNESPFCWVKKPLTFYCEPRAKVATDILSKFRDKEKYPEFYNATIIFMSPKLVADYQKNLDDVDNYREMKEFIKSYEANKDYFSFKLSDYSNKRIEQLSLAQKEFSNTWENFTNFMEIIGVKEKSNVKDVEFTYENKESDTEIRKANEKRDNNTDEPEEKLNIFMQYLKNHWPRIFKFINAVCDFFSSLKNKFNNNHKSNLRDTVDNINPKQSLINKTSKFIVTEKYCKQTRQYGKSIGYNSRKLDRIKLSL